MPESVTDRPTKSHEYVFLLSKQGRYYYDADAVREPIAESTKAWANGKDGWGPSTKDHHMASQSAIRHGNGRMGENPKGRNKRTVWTVATAPYSGSHFATFPPKLIEPMILAGSKPGDLVLDPFAGTSTVGTMAIKHNRSFVGIELNPEYIKLAQKRTATLQPMLIGVG
jgi:DNA modification methylase